MNRPLRYGHLIFVPGIARNSLNAYSALCKTQPRPEDFPFRPRSPWLLGAAFREHSAKPALLVFRRAMQKAVCFRALQGRLKFCKIRR